MILIAGDSYCASDATDSWTHILKDLLGLPMKKFSRSGCSWWSTRKDIVDEYNKNKFDDVKIAIMCHTEGSRIVNYRHMPIGGWVVENRPDWLPDEVGQAAKLYYEELHDPDFAVWAQQAWIKEWPTFFNDDCLKINLHCFPYSFLKLESDVGVNVYPPLFAISQGEHRTKKDAMRAYKTEGGDQRKNHLSDKNNQILAEELYYLITSGKKSGLHELDTTKFFLENRDAIQRESTGTGDIMFRGKII